LVGEPPPNTHSGDDMSEKMREERMQKKASKWELAVKAVKLATGALLVLAAAVILVVAVIHAWNVAVAGNEDLAFERFISDVLLVIIVLELAKTLFTYVENEEMYLHSIMEAAFIAVMRQVIMLEIENKPWADTIALAVLIVALGYVYYRMFSDKQGRH